MSRNDTQKFEVTITVKSGEVMPTQYEICRALEGLGKHWDSLRFVEVKKIGESYDRDKANGGRKMYKITKQKGKTFYNLVYDAFGGQNHQGGWVWSCGEVCATFYTEMEAEKVIKEQNLVGCSIEEI